MLLIHDASLFQVAATPLAALNQPNTWGTSNRHVCVTRLLQCLELKVRKTYVQISLLISIAADSLRKYGVWYT